MNLQPSDKSEAQGSRIAIEELKHLVNERRFVMKSYMSALGLYLALAGFALKELLVTAVVFAPILAGLFTTLNIIALYAAGRFKSMAIHAMKREDELVKTLGVNGPHSMIWGYGSGIGVVILYQIAVILVLIVKLRKCAGK